MYVGDTFDFFVFTCCDFRNRFNKVCFDNLVRYFPDSPLVPEALYLKGRALMAAGSHRDAQEALQKLCDDFPRSDLFRVAKLNIGICQVRQGNTLSAIATFEDIIAKYPTSQEARQASDLLQDVKR